MTPVTAIESPPLTMVAELMFCDLLNTASVTVASDGLSRLFSRPERITPVKALFVTKTSIGGNHPHSIKSVSISASNALTLITAIAGFVIPGHVA